MNVTRERLRALLLMVTIAWAGATVMALEIMGTRLIAPFFGMSLFVWTALISVTLLSLAVGYYLGGALTANRGIPEKSKVIYRLLLSCGLWLLVLPFIKQPCLMLGIRFGMRGGSLLSSALLFGPPLAALGGVGPLAISILSDRLEVVGRRVGYVYALSTMGSVLGALGVGFYFLPLLGLRTILLILAAVCLLLSFANFLLERKPRHAAVILVAWLIGSGAGIAKQTVIPGNVVFSGQSIYGQLSVVERETNLAGRPERTRLLLLDGIVQSGIVVSEGVSFFDYISSMEQLAKSYHPKAASFLIIGVGGGVMARSLRLRGITADLVDIDARMGEVAEEYFALPDGPAGNCFLVMFFSTAVRFCLW
jgi:predicted membrane-bound spermidine synthase